LPYEMVEKKGPYFPNTVNSEADLARLKVADAEADLAYVTEAIKIVKKELNGRVPLIGFAGAPFTIFCYMIEGSGSKTFSKSRKLLYKHPELAKKLLQMITDSTIGYLKAQIAAGANLVQLFDSWAGILPPAQYSEFSIPYMAQICEAITEVPVTVFAKGAYFARKEIAQLSCQTVGVDWNMDVEETRALVGWDKTLQGNLDPCALYGNAKEVEASTKQMLDRFGFKRHIANLGHGVYPDTDPEMVKVFVETVKSYSYQKASVTVS